MRRVEYAHVDEPQTAGAGGEPLPVNRIVLEHHKGIEQLAQPDEVLDLGKAEMLVRRQQRLGVLHVL